LTPHAGWHSLGSAVIEGARDVQERKRFGGVRTHGNKGIDVE
jgi:hypothetical protein